MTLTAERPRTRLRCVRCALAPRHNDTFLCAPCLGDPSTHLEADSVLALPVEQRRWTLMRSFGWRGGWTPGYRAPADTGAGQPA